MNFLGIKYDNVSWVETETALRLLENSPQSHIVINAGELVAVCGPTGSGKSSFLHLIAGSNISKGKVTIRGSIKVLIENNVEINRCQRCWFKHSRIVPHVDYLIPALKCNQVLEISENLTGEDKNHQILDEKIKVLNLKPFADSLVEKFDHRVDLSSRGNLKKLAILEAMTSHPKILLVDEPAYLIELKNLIDIVKGLKLYASGRSNSTWNCNHCGIDLIDMTGKCVLFAFNSLLLTMKIPSMLDGVDKIILMSASKQILFYGTVEDAIADIGQGSIEGLMNALETASTDKTPDINLAKTTKSSKHCSYRVFWYKQVFILLKRHWYQIRNHPRQVFRVVLQRILIFILLSFIFAEPKSRSSFIGIFFFLPINQTANVLLFTATEGFIPNELKMIQRARFSKLHKSWTLILAKLLILIPINVLPALIYLPELFYIAAFQTESSFIFYYLANILHIACTVPLGIFIASSSQDPFIRDLWLFGLTTLFTTFGGIHTAANFQLSWILRWIQYLSPTFYLFLILIQLEYTQEEIQNTLTLGKFILNVGEAFGALACLGILYTVLAIIALKVSTKPERILF